MPHKDPEANRLYKREWARRDRLARGEKPNRVAYRSPFWDRVDKGPGCWTWRGSRITKGYGTYRGVYAHRYAYQDQVGPIPDGMLVCHHCDNPPCVNPAHLFVGTVSDNFIDMMLKGRRGRGLTPAIVLEIRRQKAAGARTGALASEYRVARQTITDIVARRTWAYVVEPAQQSFELDVAS